MIYFATINILLSSSTFCYQFYNYYCKINDFTNNNNRHCRCYFFHTLFCFLRLRREALKIKAVIICTTIADSFAEGDSKNDEIIPELLSEWFITFCHEITEKEDLHKWVAMSYFNSLNYHRYLCYFPPPVMSVTCPSEYHYEYASLPCSRCHRWHCCRRRRRCVSNLIFVERMSDEKLSTILSSEKNVVY